MYVYACACIYVTLYYFHYQNTRTGRGFRLGIRRKNEERKKKATSIVSGFRTNIDKCFYPTQLQFGYECLLVASSREAGHRRQSPHQDT